MSKIIKEGKWCPQCEQFIPAKRFKAFRCEYCIEYGPESLPQHLLDYFISKQKKYND